MQTLYPNQVTEIGQIIDRTRFEDEMFLHDSIKAAVCILEYLNNEGMLVGRVVKMEAAKEVKQEFY